MKTCLCFFSFLAVAGLATAEEWRSVFNGENLDGWDTYVGPSWSEGEKEFVGNVPGLNNDPKGVFSVVEVDGTSTLKISGEDFGGISTHEEFENYHLQMQFKWGENRFAPRADAMRDSGLLYHAVGKHAADWFFWMRSQEFQVQEGDCGDYWGLVGANVSVASRQMANGDYIYDESSESHVFHVDQTEGRHCVKFPDGEYPRGEWNTLDLYCLGGTSVHVVNGVVTMVLRNSSQPNDNGTGFIPLTKGKIQLQSEGAEVYYRTIRVRDIKGLPFGIE